MSMKAPYRLNNDITQNFGDGIVKIYAVSDEASPGYAPKEKRTLKCTLRYQEERLGINRLYQARQLQTEIERVVRIPKSGIDITNRDQAETENGIMYRIDSVQSVDEAFPAALDLALVRIEQGAS